MVVHASTAAARHAKVERLLRACAWCERIDVEGRWLEPATAIKRLRTYEWVQAPRFTHGVCDSCLTDLLRKRENQAREDASAAA